MGIDHTMHARLASSGPGFLDDGGETGALMRAFDWARTPLGPIQGWPQSLKTTVGILLRSPVAMVLLWGPECLSVNKLNDLSDLCFGARREIGAADVDQREPRSLRPEQASLPK